MAGFDSLDVLQENLIPSGFVPPSIQELDARNGLSYTYHSPVPDIIATDKSIPCVLGVDEAGRGPLLGPMVYGVFYLPISLHESLLANTYHFDDSKVLAPAVRSSLVETLCKPGTDLHRACGWATRAISAQDISAGMLKPGATYNLNAQAMDATMQIIREVLAKGVNVTTIYVDTIGNPSVYQRKLEQVFPALAITVAKKADSLYPCVSAASVCAKVTRDTALAISYQSYATNGSSQESAPGWGSGYPSDPRCMTWLKQHMHPIFGWGNVCRFSWAPAKELLEQENAAVRHDWPQQDQSHIGGLNDFLVTPREKSALGTNGLASGFGSPVEEDLL